MNLLQQATTELLRSNTDKKHPFRYFSLSTLATYPEARMVVSRKIESDLTVLLYTDSRTPKVRQIQANNKVTALFYHPKKRLQIRLKGTVALIQKGHPLYDTYLARVQQSSFLRDYTTRQAPGSSLSLAEVEYGKTLYFTALLIQPSMLDILLLQRTGHLRCSYKKEGKDWLEDRLVP